MKSFTIPNGLFFFVFSVKVQKVHLFRNFANFCEIQEKKTPNWKNFKIKIWIQNKYDKLQVLRNIFLGRGRTGRSSKGNKSRALAKVTKIVPVQ